MKIHSTAIVAKSAEIDSEVEIGPYSIIGPNVKIGAGSRIMSHCVVEGHTTIGKNCSIYSSACVGTPPQDKKYKNFKSYVVIGDDNIIREYVTVNPGTLEATRTVIGNRNIIMIGCHVAHDCVLGNDITMANLVGLSGHVEVEDNVVIGGMSAFHQFVRIGKHSMVGGMAKVVVDVPPFSICDGHPARYYGINVVGLRRAGFPSKRAFEIKRALSVLCASGLSRPHAAEKLQKDFQGNEDVKYLLEFVAKTKRGIPRSSKEYPEVE